MSLNAIPFEFIESKSGEFDLCDTLSNAVTVQEFIGILRNTTCNFHQMIRPRCSFLCKDAIMHDSENEEYHRWSFEEALQVAQIFKDRLGVVVISRMDTYYAGKCSTMMDGLDYEIEAYPNYELAKLFHKACEQLGFKRARECNPKSLHRLHVDSNARYEVLEANHARFKIELLLEVEPLRKSINNEIIMEVFKPARIQKWIEAGNDLEDYMN